jgi:zinc-binding alcohol dehydrogenase family protein
MTRAIAFTKFGGPEVLEETQLPVSKPTNGEIGIRVKAVSVNPIDVKVRKGSPTFTSSLTGPRIVGWDGSGVVETLGEGATKFKIGDEVYFAGNLHQPGCYAEVFNIDERIVSLKPKKLSFTDAAAMPLTALTAWEAFCENLRLSPNGDRAPRSVLIVNAAGGVGSIAVQLAKNVLKSSRVIATASREESIQWVKKLGATDVIDHRKPLVEQIKNLNVEGGGVDVVLINYEYGNELIKQLSELMNPLGSIVAILPPNEPLDLSVLFFKRLTLSFELMFTRPIFNSAPEIQGEVLQRVANLLDEGVLVPTRSGPVRNLWKDIVQAHKEIESGKVIGKIVLSLE